MKITFKSRHAAYKGWHFQSGLLTASLWVIVTPSHVTSDTRPSCFLTCTIEKLGMGLGMSTSIHIHRQM